MMKIFWRGFFKTIKDFIIAGIVIGAFSFVVIGLFMLITMMAAAIGEFAACAIIAIIFIILGAIASGIYDVWWAKKFEED